jgi:hypothetical protein
MQAATSSSAQPCWTPNTHLIFWLLFCLHIAIALILKFAVGINIQAHPLVGSWDWFYHTIPTANLMQHPLTSIWYLHSQPPLLNLLGALVMHLFYPNHIQALQYLYMVLGAFSVAMSYVICLTFAKSVKLALIVALFLTCSTAFFVYEAYILYDILTTFEITTLVFLLCLYSRSVAKRRTGYLVAFLVVLTLLLLTRSLYHLLFLLPCLLIVCVLAGKQWKRLLIVGLCCSLLPLGWYLKNEQQVGVFGGSSWLGLSLWKIAGVRYSHEELQELASQGILDPAVAALPAFSRPSAYVQYGFDKLSANAEWARDDFNNINIPALSKLYQVNSLRLIAHDPARYLGTVVTSFLVFCNPASQFADIATNTNKLGRFEFIYADILQLHYPFRLLNTVGSILLILLPVSLILYGMALIKHCRLSPRRWAEVIRLDAPMLFSALLVLYTVVVCCLLEFGENFRFRFAVEVPMWALIATVHYRRYWRPPVIPVVGDSKVQVEGATGRSNTLNQGQLHITFRHKEAAGGRALRRDLREAARQFGAG